MEFRNKEISSIEELDDLGGELITYSLKLKYETNILWKPCKKKAKRLVVFLSSGGRKLKDGLIPIKFERWSYHCRDSAVLCVEDPMYIKHPDLTSAWFYGSKDYSILSEIIKPLVSKIANQIGLSNENIVFVGSSCAGYASLYLTNIFNGSKCIAINPQISIINWGKVADRLIQILKLDVTEVDKYKRLNIEYITENKDSQFFIFCNRFSKKDFDKQVKLILKKLKLKITTDEVYEKNNFIFYISNLKYKHTHSNALLSGSIATIIDYLYDSSDKIGLKKSLNESDKHFEILENYQYLKFWTENIFLLPIQFTILDKDQLEIVHTNGIKIYLKYNIKTKILKFKFDSTNSSKDFINKVRFCSDVFQLKQGHYFGIVDFKINNFGLSWLKE